MSDQEIIAKLVKIRERFRNLVQIYQNTRKDQDSSPDNVADMNAFTRADQILADTMRQMQELPEKPGKACADQENRQYADRLLKEIGDLLQTALIMDRETRRQPLTPNPATVISPVNPANVISPAHVDSPPSGAARDRALRAYSK